MKASSNVIYGVGLYFPFKTVAKTMAALRGKKITVIGRDNLPKEGAILPINHKLAIDWPPDNLFLRLFFGTLLKKEHILYDNITHLFVGASAKPFRPIHYFLEKKFSKEESGRGRSWLVKFIEQIIMYEGMPPSELKKAMRTAEEYLKANEYVGIFDGKAKEPLYKTQRLCVDLALMSGKPIIPVSVKTIPNGKRLMNVVDKELKEIVIKFGEPIDLRNHPPYQQGRGMSHQAKKELTNDVWTKVYNL